MKMPRLKFMLLSAIVAVLSLGKAHAFDEINLEEAKKIVPHYQTVRIVKENDSYFLDYHSYALLDAEGKQVTFDSADTFCKIFRRNIKAVASFAEAAAFFIASNGHEEKQKAKIKTSGLRYWRRKKGRGKR